MQNYDPYLNTYNYPYNNSEPSSSLSYQNNQMPDYRYEGGGYGDPDMSYSNPYDNDGQQYSFKEGGSVKEEDLPRLADLIRRHGRNGDTELAHINPIEAHILKSLGGSGTTLIACERSKRNCYMMELSPAYVDVIIKRWEKETNRKAVLLNE